MPASSFNPTDAVTFDLQYGHVHLDGAPNRVMIPADVLVGLCTAAGEEQTSVVGHAIGEAMGRRVAVRLAGSSRDRHEAARGTAFEDIVSNLAGELAITGFGALSAERWGRALVLVVDQSPLGEQGDGLLGEVLQAALQAMAGQQLRVVALQRDGVRMRFLVASGSSVEAIRDRLQSGASWGAVLAALHRGGSAS